MKKRNEQVSLESMSKRQQRLVEGHMPLVRLTLHRHRLLGWSKQPGREPGELYQEGCLALVEAVRSHDPTRHGHFAAFAMARIHYAMSRFAHEHSSLIRVPFMTQRRHKARSAGSSDSRHRPEPLPKVVRMNDDRKSPSRHAIRRHHPDGPFRNADRVTIGDCVRDCYDRAARRVATEMKASRRCAKGNGALIDHCLEERWTVPEPAAQTPIRKLARNLGCSIGRITHCEERFRKKLAASLRSDPACTALLRMARKRNTGLRHCLTHEEIVAMKRLSGKDHVPGSAA